MEVIKNMFRIRLGLVLYYGDDTDGNPIERRTNYIIKDGLDIEDVKIVSDSLASLSDSMLVDTILEESSTLVEI